MLLGSAEGVRQSSAIQFHDGFRQRHERSIDIVLAGWGQRQFDAVYEQGLTMSTDDAIAFAMSDTLPSRPGQNQSAAHEARVGDSKPDRARKEQSRHRAK